MRVWVFIFYSPKKWVSEESTKLNDDMILIWRYDKT